MVMNFELDFNPVSTILTSIITFHWLYNLLQLYLAHFERETIENSYYSKTLYIFGYYTEEEFYSYKSIAYSRITYELYQHFYLSIILTVIIIFEIFEITWRLSKNLAKKLKTEKEVYISMIYVAVVTTLYFLMNFPIRILNMKICKFSFGGCILKNLWNYVKLLFLTSTFTAPTYYAVKYFKRKTFAILWIVSVFVYLINMLINFNIFTSLEPITGGTLKTKLESKLNKIGFSIDYVYHSEEEEINEKVYFVDTWIGKTVVITGTIPPEKNLSLFNDTNEKIEFSTDEIVALVVFKVGSWVNGYKYLNLISFLLHSFFLTIIFLRLYEEEYVYEAAGFHAEKPVIANLLLIAFFFYTPYRQIIYDFWLQIYSYWCITEAEIICSTLNLQDHLQSAFVKIYKLNNIFPNHDLWYGIFNNYERPLSTLIRTLSATQLKK